jgi:hypothetical protein
MRLSDAEMAQHICFCPYLPTEPDGNLRPVHPVYHPENVPKPRSSGHCFRCGYDGLDVSEHVCK